jgi:Na+-driven multidrug efflux pump
VGQWIGSLAIAAVTVVLPITFLISWMARCRGSLSRALGANDREKAHRLWQSDQDDFYWLLYFVLLLQRWNAIAFVPKEQLCNPLKNFYPIIISVPFLALCMMGNNVIRAEGKANLLWWRWLSPLCQYWLIFFYIYELGMFMLWPQPYHTQPAFFVCVFILKVK